MKCVLTAMAMAMDDSVTVSMGDEMRGVFRVIFLVSADVRSFQTNQRAEMDDKKSGQRSGTEPPV